MSQPEGKLQSLTFLSFFLFYGCSLFSSVSLIRLFVRVTPVHTGHRAAARLAVRLPQAVLIHRDRERENWGEDEEG